MTNDSVTAKHVLVVEDEPDFAALLRSILTKAGYTVATTYYCDQALSVVRDTRPDIITLDMQMPGKSGAFLYRKLKADKALQNIPVVVVTGVTRNDRDMENLVWSFLETDNVPPPEAYLEKPLNERQFLRTIQDVLEFGVSANC